MENGTGIGIFCESLEIRRSVRLNNNCSIFQAEVFAVAEAARIISIMKIDRSAITIYIDSQAAIKAIASRNIRSKVVSRCQRELRALMEQHNIKLCWVPGHTNIYGNEEADKLAKESLGLPSEDINMAVYPPLSFFSQEITDRTKAISRSKWDDSDRCRMTKQTWSMKGTDTKYILTLGKNDLRILVGILTGHNRLKSHLRTMGITSDELCRWCWDSDVIENTEHFLCHCPALSQKRKKIMSSFFIQIDELNRIGTDNIMRFIKESEWRELEKNVY